MQFGLTVLASYHFEPTFCEIGIQLLLVVQGPDVSPPRSHSRLLLSDLQIPVCASLKFKNRRSHPRNALLTRRRHRLRASRSSRRTSTRNLEIGLPTTIIRIHISSHIISRSRQIHQPQTMASSSSYDISLAATTVICSTTGVLANFAFFCMNTTINYITMPALLLGHPQHATSKAASKNSGPPTIPHLNRQWQEVYFRGHKVGPGLALGAGLAHGSAAYFARETAVKWFFGAAAATSIAIVPYTLLVMLSTNDELHERAASSKEIDGQKTLGLLYKWVGMSKTRANIAMLSACFAAVGIITLARG